MVTNIYTACHSFGWPKDDSLIDVRDSRSSLSRDSRLLRMTGSKMFVLLHALEAHSN
jgi:hypothetical protein